MYHLTKSRTKGVVSWTGIEILDLKAALLHTNTDFLPVNTEVLFLPDYYNKQLQSHLYWIY